MGGIPYKMQRDNNQRSKQTRKQTSSSKGGALVKAPVAQNRSSRQSGKNGQRYRECERILTIPGSVSFSVVGSIPVNPALSTSFPWLSGHAALFDKYKVHKLVYRYKNLKGTSANGNVLMSFDYDTLDSPPGSALQMTQATRWVDGAPWRVFELNVPTDGRVLFTRRAVVAGSDLKTYDMGRLYVATEACADTSDHGYLEVEYDIELFDKSPIDSQVAVAKSTSLFCFQAPQNVANLSPIPFTLAVINALGIQCTSGTFTLPAGAYLCTFEIDMSNSQLAGVFVNGQQVSIGGATYGYAGPASSSITAYVVSDGTTTVQCRNVSGGVSTFDDRQCRAIFTLA